MKNNKIFLSLFLLLICIGCDDFLTKEPLASFTDEDFWTSETSVRAFSMGYYASRFPGFGQNDGGGSMFTRQPLNDDFTNINLPGFAAQPTNKGGSWGTYFNNIRKDNIFIDRVSTMKFDDEATAKHWIGIARFFRALDYSNFVLDFGDVPYYDYMLTDSDTELYRPRDPIAYVMDKVLEDCQYASANVKISDPLTGPNGLIVNKDVVDAFMSRQLLFVGTTIKYNPNSTGADIEKASIYLQASKDAADRVISAGRYSVANNYQKICSTIDIGATANVKQEMILYRIYDTGMITHAVQGYNNDNVVQGYSAPKDVIDSYLCTNGMPIKTTNGINPLYLGDQSIENQMKNRDPRLGNTFRTDEYYLQFLTNGYATTGYKSWKFLDVPTKDQPYSYQSFNITDSPIIRLGEVMMNYIEAAAELMDMDKYIVIQSDLDKTINRLRKRSGDAVANRLPDMKIIGNFPAVGNTIYEDADRDPSVPSFIWEIRRERRLELIYEGFRLQDLRRWRKLSYTNTELFPKKNLGAWITKSSVTKKLILADIDGNITSAADKTSGSGYLKVSQTPRNETNGNVHDRAYLECVPIYEIDFYAKNGVTLTQNPGWPQGSE